MLKIEAIIQASRFEDTKAALEALAIRELIVSEVMDHGHGYATNFYRGAEYHVPVGRVKLEMLVSDDAMDSVVSSVMRAARTRVPGDIDGRILVYEVADAINIHSGEHLQYLAA
jgi:nitrogen regulatory protein P-II 1